MSKSNDDDILMAVGLTVAGIGVALIGIGFNMNTSVSTELGRVNNIGLLHQQSNYLLVGGFLLIVGIICAISAHFYLSKNNQIKCRYCAENIKADANICRYCGSSLIASLNDSGTVRAEQLNEKELNDLIKRIQSKD